MARIYQSYIASVGEYMELSEEAGQHVGVVLRKQVGDKITLFCGDQREYQAKLVAVQKKRVRLLIEAEQMANRESPRAIHLAQAISKGDRMEWVVQKAVELGITSISPIMTERSVVRLEHERMLKKVNQWQSIVISACEQSGRNYIPIVHPVLTLDQYLTRTYQTLKFVLDPNSSNTWRDYQWNQDELSLLVGPEGGLSLQEVEQILSAEFKPLRLGPRVLRTETAAIVAIGIVQALCGDL